MSKTKKMIMLWTSLASLLMVSVSAQAFQIEAYVSVSPNFVQGTACNEAYDQPILCRTTAFGILPNGVSINAWANLYLLPGQCENAYVYANYPYYFVDGYATAYCQFAM